MPIDMTNMTEAQKLLARNMIEKEGILKDFFSKEMFSAQRSISEAAFIYYFLPWLSAEVQDTTGELYTAWLKIAGDSFSSVSLTNSAGEVVAIVPGIVDRNVLSIKEDRRERMSSIVSTADKLSELSVVGASEQTYQQLTKAVDLDGASVSPTRAWVDSWGVLLARYGKHPAQKAQQAQVADKEQLKQDDDITFE